MRSYVVYFAGGDADFFLYTQTMHNAHGCASNCRICPGCYSATDSNLVIVFFAGSHFHDSQFAYRWYHSPMASIDPRAILSQYHTTVISPSGIAERSNAQTLPTQKGAPRLRSSSGEHTATNCPIVISLCGLNAGNASSPVGGRWPPL